MSIEIRLTALTRKRHPMVTVQDEVIVVNAVQLDWRHGTGIKEPAQSAQPNLRLLALVGRASPEPKASVQLGGASNRANDTAYLYGLNSTVAASVGCPLGLFHLKGQKGAWGS